jgi:ribonucleotide reductase alpha subunit
VVVLDELMERIAKDGLVQHAEVPSRGRRVFVTAKHLAARCTLRMQAALQQHSTRRSA